MKKISAVLIVILLAGCAITGYIPPKDGVISNLYFGYVPSPNIYMYAHGEDCSSFMLIPLINMKSAGDGSNVPLALQSSKEVAFKVSTVGLGSANGGLAVSECGAFFSFIPMPNENYQLHFMSSKDGCNLYLTKGNERLIPNSGQSENFRFRKLKPGFAKKESDSYCE